MSGSGILDDNLIERLFYDLYKPLCLYSLHYVADADVAEDVVQDSFLAYWNYCKDGGVAVSPRAYLFRTVRNRSIDFIRKNADVSLDNVPYDLENLISDDEALSRSDSEAKLWSAIDNLPEQRRKVLLMNKRDNMKYSEIARELGISVFTVRNQISRALSSLRHDSGLSLDLILVLIVF